MTNQVVARLPVSEVSQRVTDFSQTLGGEETRVITRSLVSDCSGVSSV